MDREDLEALKGKVLHIKIGDVSDRASSYADGGTVMWLLEACKTKMMDSI